MKIAIDARIINSGTGRYIERLLHYLEELDTANDYFILVRKADLNFYQPRNPRFQIVEADFENYSFSEQLGLAALLYKLRPNLVHFCMPQQPVLYFGKHITTVHDLTLLNTYSSDKNFIIYKIKQTIGRFVFYAVAHTSAHILCPSQFTKDAFALFARIKPDKITVTYEGCDISIKDPQPYPPLEDKQFLLYVGQQSDYKNIRRLMEAHQELRKVHPQLLLVLVGRLSGKNGLPLLRNKAWAEEQKFSGIVYTDFLPDGQLGWLYQKCAAYVFPSTSEGFGLPGLEAMACGAPVASSNATCLPEVYGNGAHYFDPYLVEDMAAKVNQILTNADLRTTLIANGRAIAARYSWERMAQQTLTIYQRQLG